MTACPTCGTAAGHPVPITTGPLVLSLTEAATALGVSRRTVERLRHDGHLPASMIGGRAVIPRADLDAYVASLSGAAPTPDHRGPIGVAS